MEIKDMKNFVYYYTFHIRKFHRYKHPEDEVMHEVMIIVFKHIKYNYRIYNEPHEVSLLINSMRTKVRFRSEEHTSELQSRGHLVCRLLLEKKNNTTQKYIEARSIYSLEFY